MLSTQQPPAGSEVPIDLEVEVAAIRYRAPDGDFAVVDALGASGEPIVMTGAIAYLHEGEQLSVSGRWREHPRHGLRLEVRQARHREPTGEAGLMAALGAIKHIGPRGAAFLYGRYGEEVLSVVDRAPHQRLKEVPGIGRARIAEAVGSWEEQRGQRALRMFLAEHGVEAAVAGRIYRAWGERSVEQLRADPYALTTLPGVGFGSADALARALGVEPLAPERIGAGLLHVLGEAELDGHCFLPRGELERRAASLLAGGTPEDPWSEGPVGLVERLGEQVDAMRAAGRLVVVAGSGAGVGDGPEDGGEPGAAGELVYSAEMHALEQRLAGYMRELIEGEPALARMRAEPRHDGDFTPTEDQWRAVELALEHRLSILTGGPGTGKTTSMRVLVSLLAEAGASVRLCAPTGKAARRLAAAAGGEASTIHRLLEWMPVQGFTRDRDNRLEEIDMLIVDEASMLGVRLAEALFAAVGPETHVLLVGDVDQLAAIGPGRVLDDLIASQEVPVTALHDVFRQAERSLIVRAAHAINEGRGLPAAHAGGESAEVGAGAEAIRDFFLLSRAGEAEIFEEVVSLSSERLAAHFGLDPRIDIQVLAPMRRGPVGIEALNAELRRRLNPDGAAVPGCALRVGDRVIQTRNDHEHDLMNGEVALLERWDPEVERVVLSADGGRRLSLPLGALESVEPAYAISIHKSQGSQTPAIVLALARSQRIMLTRNLLYTAVTRAERVCVVVAQPGAIDLALARREARRRNTRLAERLGGRPLAA